MSGPRSLSLEEWDHAESVAAPIAAAQALARLARKVALLEPGDQLDDAAQGWRDDLTGDDRLAIAKILAVKIDELLERALPRPG